MPLSLAAWIIPLTFLPGIGALVLSTSNRFFHVNNLIRTSIKEKDQDEEYLKNLLRRSEFFHSALTFLYVAVALFSIAALLANLYQNWFVDQMGVVIASDGLVLAGVVCVVLAAIQLIQESFLSARVLRKQVEGKASER